MGAIFNASVGHLRNAAAFLEALNDATAGTTVRIDGPFTIALSEDGDTIEARYDGEQYVIEDQVGR